MREEDKPYLNGREMSEMTMLMCYSSRIRQSLETVKRRAEQCGIRRTYAKWACAVGLIDSALDDIYDTMPIKALRHIESMARCGEIMVRIKPTASHEHGQTVIDNENMITLLNAAMDGECSICLNEGRDARDCELRKVLQVLIPPDEYKGYDVCPYVRAHVDGYRHMNGKEE